MNPDTGEIATIDESWNKEKVMEALAYLRGESMKSFLSVEEAEKAGFTIPLKHPPNPNCVKCNGKGHKPDRNSVGQFDPCSCTQ